MTVSDTIAIVSTVVSAIVAILLYSLQRRLTDKQKIDNRLDLERSLKDKLYQINYNSHSRKIQLYNSKLLGKTYFSQNKRNVIWGYPFHGADLYTLNFDGIEAVVGIEQWSDKKYYKVGLIPYDRVLGVKPEGDGSFNGCIFYVKPKLIQLDKYSIAYSKFRYYEVEAGFSGEAKKVLRSKFNDTIKQALHRTRHHQLLETTEIKADD